MGMISIVVEQDSMAKLFQKHVDHPGLNFKVNIK